MYHTADDRVCLLGGQSRGSIGFALHAPMRSWAPESPHWPAGSCLGLPCAELSVVLGTGPRKRPGVKGLLAFGRPHCLLRGLFGGLGQVAPSHVC